MTAALLLADAAISRPAIRMTVAGDSLALGIGASDSSRGFAFDLYRRVERLRPGSEITNVAIGATTARDVLRLEVPRLAETAPDVVLIEAGANDAVQHRTPAEFRRDFRALVARIRHVVPTARLVIFTVPDVSVSPIFEADSKRALHKLVIAYNHTVVAEAARVHASVADLFSFSQRARGDALGFFSADEFHPSDAGHAAIADAAWPAVRSNL